jgi:hypothetical protein
MVLIFVKWNSESPERADFNFLVICKINVVTVFDEQLFQEDVWKVEQAPETVLLQRFLICVFIIYVL